MAGSGPGTTRLKWLFLGREGLRAGWGLALFAAILSGLTAAAFLLLRRAHLLGGPDPVRAMTVSEAALALAVLAASWIMARIERRPAGAYGLGGRRRGRHLLQGLFWGAASLALLILALLASGHLRLRGPLPGPGPALAYGALFALVFALVALFEEYLMRGYLQTTLARGLKAIAAALGAGARAPAIGFWAAALVLSFLFGYGHGSNPGESPLGLVAAGLVALLFCLSLWYSGSLWWALGFHTSWDWAQTYLFGTANSGITLPGHLLTSQTAGSVLWSGGATGPEGSLLILPALAGLAFLLKYTLGRER